MPTPGDNADFPSPGASPVSESSFPKISQVYSTEDHFIPETFTGSDAQNVTVSPIQEAKFYPDTSTQDYSVQTNAETAPGYYVSYPSSTYPTNSYSTASFSGNSANEIYPNTCVSPNYLGSYQATTGKGYSWPTTPNGVGYGAFGMTPSDVYQYQAQTAVYQQMAATRANYPNYFTAGQSATLPPT